MGAVSCWNYFLSTKPRLFTGEGVHIIYGREVFPQTAQRVNINGVLFELSCRSSYIQTISSPQNLSSFFGGELFP